MINIPGCPAHPDWITQIIVALAAGRVGDLALDELQRPETFFTTFTQTGCTRVQFFEYKQRPADVRPGHAHRLPVLRVRLPRPDDALAVQPHPVEPAVLQDPRRPCPAPAAPSPGYPHGDLDAGHGVQDPEGRRRDPQGRARPASTT